MTAAKIEESLLDLTQGLGRISEGIRNLEAQYHDVRDTGRRDVERFAQNLTEIGNRLTGLEKGLIPIEAKLAAMEKRSEDGRKTWLAVGLAVLSTVLSLGSAVFVAYLVKVGDLK